MSNDDFYALFWTLACIGLYFLPAIVAGETGPNKGPHHNRPAIFALNLMLGWTGIGWVAALVWALTRDKP